MKNTLRRARQLVRATGRITLVAGVFAAFVIIAWEQVDDRIEARIDKLTTVTYVSARTAPVTPAASPDAELVRKKQIYEANLQKYWDDTTQQYLKEQLALIQSKLASSTPLDAALMRELKEDIRRTEVSL